jgi:hypothetical protein
MVARPQRCQNAGPHQKRSRRSTTTSSTSNENTAKSTKSHETARLRCVLVSTNGPSMRSARNLSVQPRKAGYLELETRSLRRKSKVSVWRSMLRCSNSDPGSPCLPHHFRTKASPACMTLHQCSHSHADRPRGSYDLPAAGLNARATATNNSARPTIPTTEPRSQKTSRIHARRWEDDGYR